MPNQPLPSEVPYYYDFDGATMYLRFHVETVFHQAINPTNKFVLHDQLRRRFVDNVVISSGLFIKEREAPQNQDQRSMVQKGAIIVKLINELPISSVRAERTAFRNWLKEYRSKMYGVCMQKNMLDIHLKEYISEIAHYHLNNASYETCHINITRVMQCCNSKNIGPRQQIAPRRKLTKYDDLDIQGLINEFLNSGRRIVKDQDFPENSRYVLLQHLRHLIQNYIVSEQAKLIEQCRIHENNRFLDQNKFVGQSKIYEQRQAKYCSERSNIHKNTHMYSVFDLLRIFGYTCLLTGEVNSKLTYDEKRIRDSMAMEFVNVSNFADDVISACDNHLELGFTHRMSYTNTFS